MGVTCSPRKRLKDDSATTPEAKRTRPSTRHQGAHEEGLYKEGKQKILEAFTPCTPPQRLPASGAAQKVKQTQQLTGKLVGSITNRSGTFLVGDDVYVVTDPEKFNAAGGLNEQEEFEVCEVCHKAGHRNAPLLECSGCARGFHTKCVGLTDVPKDDWFCTDCKTGDRTSQAARITTLRQRFLAGGHGLDVCRIISITAELGSRIDDEGAASEHSDDAFQFCGRWYARPEETHTGRNAQHAARELFMTHGVDAHLAGEAILRQCTVLDPHSFAESSAAGDDVFLCQYVYNERDKKFQRIDEEGYDDDSDDNGEYQPSYEPESLEEPKCLPHTRRRPHVARRLPYTKGRKNMQGGAAWELGAPQIPEAAPQNPFEAAKAALATTAQPCGLPCREQERGKIEAFVRSALLAGEGAMGSCMFIGGKPGTGKTASVMGVIRHLRREVEDGGLPDFQFVDVNGLRLPTPKHAYSALHEKLFGVRVGPKAAAEVLATRFGGEHPGGAGAARMTIMLVDEMDQMLKGRQEVLYNLMEWPLQRDSRLAVIGIGNTIDMPERLLPRINSRLGGNKIAYPPYSNHNMREIMVHRLATAADPRARNLFHSSALDLTTIKAAHTSDLRKSLQLGIRAIELAEAELLAHGAALQELPSYDHLVTIEHVIAASREMFGGNEVLTQMSDNLPTQCQLFLAAMLVQVRITGVPQMRLAEVHQRAVDMAASHGMDIALLEVTHSLAAAVQLKAQGFIHAAGEGPGMHLAFVQDFPDHILRTSLRRHDAVPWLKDINLG